MFYVYTFVRLSVCMYTTRVQVPAAARAGVTGRVLYGCWETNLSPLQEQQSVLSC